MVAGNWKMNTSMSSAVELAEQVIQAKTSATVEKLFFPPFPFVAEVAKRTQNVTGFFCGAQNCSRHSKGAYTGEVSAAMLQSAGATHVLIGHSERRTYFNETSTELKEKIQQALDNGLHVLFCFGEQLSERKNGKQFDTVKQQLEEVLAAFPPAKLNALTLAYEPVWAIGTGETATPAQAQEMHAFIRTVLAGIFSPQVAAATSILYGGSCNAQNAAELFACPDVDGGLIGGASLNAADFCKIINSFT